MFLLIKAPHCCLRFVKVCVAYCLELSSVEPDVPGSSFKKCFCVLSFSQLHWVLPHLGPYIECPTLSDSTGFLSEISLKGFMTPELAEYGPWWLSDHSSVLRSQHPTWVSFCVPTAPFSIQLSASNQGQKWRMVLLPWVPATTWWNRGSSWHLAFDPSVLPIVAMRGLTDGKAFSLLFSLQNPPSKQK